jgi:hypothetical protein
VVCALEADVEAVRCRVGMLKDLVEEGALPPSGRDRVVAPWLADRQRPRLEAPVPGTFERHGALNRWHGAQVVERELGRVLDRTGNLERAVVARHREVASDIVELDRSDLVGKCFGRRLCIEGRRVDHSKRSARFFELVCYCHVSVSSRGWLGSRCQRQ